MRLTFGINDHVFVIEATRATMARSGEPDATDPPAIFDVSRAETQIRPQWDHEGPVPVARLGFQPNGGGEVSGIEGERVNLIYWDEEMDLRKMQAKVNEMAARMAELQQHYGYTWIGNPETGEWRLRREVQA